MAYVRDTTTLRQIKGFRPRDATALRTAKTVLVRTAAGLKTVFSSMTAAVDITAVVGYGFSPVPSDIATSPLVTASPVGGAGPYTYSWTTGDAGWAANNPTAASTVFTATAVAVGSPTTATFVCTITDVTGATAVTPPVSASAYNVYFTGF